MLLEEVFGKMRHWCFFLLALLKGVERLEGIIIYFVGCCLFSIVVNDVPAFFKPLERMVQYLLLLLAVSPLMRSYGIDRLRINLMETIVISLGILSLGSFVFYMAGGESVLSDTLAYRSIPIF